MERGKLKEVSEEELERMAREVVSISLGYEIASGIIIREGKGKYKLIGKPHQERMIEVLGPFSAGDIGRNDRGGLEFRSPLEIRRGYSHKGAGFSGENYAVLEKEWEGRKIDVGKQDG